MKKHQVLLSVQVLLSGLTCLALLPAAVDAQGSAAESTARTGVASWYGGRHEGLRTSSGETFDQEGMTAASRDLPLGSRVRVTLHETGRSVIVRVNDRMGARSAVIDLSRGAAKEIGLLGRGRGTVSIDPAASEPEEVAEAPDSRTADAPVAPRYARPRARHAARQLISAHHLMDRRPARHRL